MDSRPSECFARGPAVQCDRETTEEMSQLQYVDEEGYNVIFTSDHFEFDKKKTFMISVGFASFNWGLSVRNKTERMV